MSYQIGGLDVLLGPTIRPESEASGPYAEFDPSTTILEKGHRKRKECLPFPVDTVLEKDVALPMRDGVKLYCDIFRPQTKEKVPALLLWSPYGKSGNGPHSLNMIPGRFGVAQERLSDYEKFEGLDPATWTEMGYAIVNVDLRGSWDSEGTVPWLGEQDGKDGYDAIEHIASLEWCSGKVGLAGNSWLAMSQWFIASQQPPHLAAFAPWEGASDFYRDTLCRGGVTYPYDAMWKLLEDLMVGRNETESCYGMITKYPLYNDYWEDKRAKLDKIVTPAYILASYSSSLHTTGSLRAFRDISTKEKWLRIHPTQEWHDLYNPQNVADLKKFFDYYLKDVKNDWTSTTPVRVSVIGFDKKPVVNVEYPSYPPKSTNTKLFLGPNSSLTTEPSKDEGKASYNAEINPKEPESIKEEVSFVHKFTKPTWLVGYSWIVLHVSSDQDDIDVFVQIRKLDQSGNPLECMNVPMEDLIPTVKSSSEIADSCFLKYLGPSGSLRASHAATKVSASGSYPEYKHDARKPVEPNTVVRLEIPIIPTGIFFDAGESIAVKVAGHYMGHMEFPDLKGASHENKGKVTLYFGDKYDSHLVLPLTEPRSS